MISVKHSLAALALLAISSTVATAQTDFGSAMGAGSGAGGTFAPFTDVPPAAIAPAVTPAGQAAFSAALAGFAGATGPVRVPSAAGGNAELSAVVMQALAGVLSGRPTAAQTEALRNALDGVPAMAAGNLVQSLTQLGARGVGLDGADLAASTTSYNMAIDAVPAGATPPPVLAAIRFALFQASKM